MILSKITRSYMIVSILGSHTRTIYNFLEIIQGNHTRPFFGNHTRPYMTNKTLTEATNSRSQRTY